MTLKINTSSLKNSPAVAPRTLYLLLQEQHQTQSFPELLRGEIRAFTQRNAIVRTQTRVQGRGEPITCLQCLKAHLLQRAQELKLDSLALSYIRNNFPGKIGHDGYYLDEERLIKLTNASIL